MQKLILQDVRCFTGQHELPIRPLTLLVGENSTGKTTLLALARVASDLQLGRPPEFNEEPFRLGSFDQIATFRGGRAGRASQFVVGQVLDIPRGRREQRRLPLPGEQEVRLEATFEQIAGQPSMSKLEVSGSEVSLIIERPEGEEPSVSIRTKRGIIRPSEQDVRRGLARGYVDWRWLGLTLGGRIGDRSSELQAEERSAIDHLLTAFIRARETTLPFAPIRTRPERAYEPRREVRQPEGDHVPMVLSRVLGGPEIDEKLRTSLEEFGASSGLFSDVRVHKLGRKGSDPFQIEVKHPQGGPHRNLVDVGYGVSQVIPILVDALMASPDDILLIQQPEVHLHPRAQAELGSFLAKLAASGRRRIIVETHSDYLIDRVRMDVRDSKSLQASDVLIAYCQSEPQRRSVAIHSIDIDASGQLAGAPQGYRSFFLRETERLLGIE